MKGYKKYRIDSVLKLSDEIRKNGRFIAPGRWQGEQRDTFTHILPFHPLDSKNTRTRRVEAIKNYLNISIDENFLPAKSEGRGESLHPYAHHLNSSQLLCYCVFRNMLTEDHAPKVPLIQLFASFGIKITSSARCDFEYNDGWIWERGGEMEGTSFDFHISDGDCEYFFEIKFTENGFGKAADDERHRLKIKDIYLPKIRRITLSDLSTDDCLKYYQLIRNVIRADSDLKKVVFITDANNPSTTNDIKEFRTKVLRSATYQPIFLTWQEIYNKWPNGVEKPFQFICFDNTPASV